MLTPFTMHNHPPKSTQLIDKPAIIDFMENYRTANDVHQVVWEILLAAMGSEHADMWSKEERAEKMFFLEVLTNFVKEVYETVVEEHTEVYENHHN